MLILKGRIRNNASNILWQFNWSNTCIDWLTRKLSISISITQNVKNTLIQCFICTRLRDKTLPCLCMFLNHRRACFLNLNTFEINYYFRNDISWYEVQSLPFGLMNFENSSESNQINGGNKHEFLDWVHQNILSTFQKMYSEVSNVKS